MQLKEEIKTIFNKVYGGIELTKEEILKFKSAMLVIFGEMDWEKGCFLLAGTEVYKLK